jgi:hypothetical protein
VISPGISNNKDSPHILKKILEDLRLECTVILVSVGRHNDNSFIAHQSFANAYSYKTTYAVTSSLTVLNSGRNNNNGTSSVRKLTANSNKTSMSFELYAF